MRLSRWLPASGVLLLCLCATAAAQSSAQCPTLPAGTRLQWHVVDGPDFVFCRAVDSSTGQQRFAVSIGRDAQFKPRRNNRIGNEVSIDGNAVYWYEGDVAFSPDMLIRETLLELDSGAHAHIIVRASDETQLGDTLQDVQGLRFSGTQLGAK
ncbi:MULTISPECIES: hypothetical protein [Luteimonas]|uniref:hypothetical protein n=1 Tax=Luteimonas TaxID=83614 RepID=UPI000C7B6DFD|nr:MULTISPECIES: hypothetical protein [Luteimonas]